MGDRRGTAEEVQILKEINPILADQLSLRVKDDIERVNQSQIKRD